jgi:hypothetical protein
MKNQKLLWLDSSSFLELDAVIESVESGAGSVFEISEEFRGASRLEDTDRSLLAFQSVVCPWSTAGQSRVMWPVVLHRRQYRTRVFSGLQGLQFENSMTNRETYQSRLICPEFPHV